MRISMWMIANMLKDEDCIADINFNAQENLFGAGFSETPGRVGVKKVGNDVVCTSENNRITIRNCSFVYAFERIQQIFDFYNEWQNTTLQLCREHKWEEIIKNMEPMFPYPLVLFDANMKVIALSSKYGLGTVDTEWDYLLNYGVSSDTAIKAGRSRPRFLETLHEGPGYYFTPPAYNGSPSYLTISIKDSEETWAYLSSVSLGSPFTHGEIDSLYHLALIISSNVQRTSSRSTDISKDIFREFLINRNAEDYDSLVRRISIYGWNEDDHYSVFCAYFKTDVQLDFLHRMYISGVNTLNIPTILFSDMIVFILDTDNQLYESTLTKLNYLASKLGAITVQSLALKKIRNIYYEFNQIQFVIKKITDSTRADYNFYDFAINYIILHSDRDSLLHACHPEIYKFFSSEDDHSDLALTLELYLKTGRSLQETAAKLYVHKNTITYRVQKALEIAKIDINDIYTRNYAILSFDLMRALGYM